MKFIAGLVKIGVVLAVLAIIATCNIVRGDTSLDYIAYANKMEEKYNLPTNLVVAICTHENRSAVWRNVAGQHGEVGVCQIKPDTARMLCPTCESEGAPLILGSIGNRVRIVQEIVHVTVDGIFGEQTLKGVLKFQNYHRLRVDGIVGKHTWKAMTGQILTGESMERMLWNPLTNIEFAARYLAWLRDFVGDDLALIAAAYNGGPASPVITYARKVKEIMESYQLRDVSRNFSPKLLSKHILDYDYTNKQFSLTY